ncbi:hypothetical protein HMPREF1867_00112 [Veillonella dispar]|nr:hypothetical protein HMPREF1867_00112 [Veillonella dispar]
MTIFYIQCRINKNDNSYQLNKIKMQVHRNAFTRMIRTDTYRSMP